MVTKNRIGNALAVAAAVVGLVLVFSGAGHGDTGDTPAAPPPAGQVQAPAHVPVAPAAPQPKDGDDDG
ncbi:hypothetical protein [Actinomycetospora sp. TBRC 11914]|uniref:hypothetical protein n=1 Tax=Actinomycetospora sp. TBRC 11914 TaxID=2729387 RepID=UPI00145E17BA|nr:hypothetical protein [Actinomycetospora sp. TBRC 11914]NMO89348.1 hypothetical protein [Actinomycetospora sp. TBRC 11914]